MEVYLPMIESVLRDWYQLTLAHQEYATSLALAVWLLTAMFYSIRIYFLKKTNAINLKARMVLQSSLEAAQQQLQTVQEQLAANTEQLETVQAEVTTQTQRASALEEKIVQGHRQLIDGIKSLAASFEVAEPALPAANDLQSGDLWPRYTAFGAQISERFKTEQQGKTELQLALWTETSKLAEKEALLGPLQLRLDAQTEQLSKLELAVEEQKILREREQASAGKRLAEMVEKQQAELAAYADGAKRPVAAVTSQAPQAAAQTESKINVVSEAPVMQVRPVEVVEPVVAVAPPAPVEQPKIVEQQVALAANKPVVAEPVTAKQSSVDKLAEKSGGFGKFKQMLNNTMAQMAKLDQKLGTQTASASELIEEEIEQIAAPVVEAVAEIREASVELAHDAVEAVEASAAGVGSRLKNLFGKSKPAASPVAVQALAVEPEPEPIVEAALAEPAPAKPDRLKSLFKKWK